MHVTLSWGRQSLPFSVRSSLLSTELDRLDEGREMSIWPGMIGNEGLSDWVWKEGLSDWERLLLLLPGGTNDGPMNRGLGKQHNTTYRQENNNSLHCLFFFTWFIKGLITTNA